MSTCCRLFSHPHLWPLLPSHPGLFTSSDHDFWVLPALDGQCTSSKKPPSDHGWDPVFSLWLQSKLPSSLNCLLSPAAHPLSPNPPSAPTLQLPSPDLSWRWTVHTLLLAHQAWFFFFFFLNHPSLFPKPLRSLLTVAWHRNPPR